MYHHNSLYKRFKQKLLLSQVFFLKLCLYNLIWNSIFISWNANSVVSHSILMCRIGVFCSSVCSLIISFYVFGCHSQSFITLLFIALKSTDISGHTIFNAFPLPFLFTYCCSASSRGFRLCHQLPCIIIPYCNSSLVQFRKCPECHIMHLYIWLSSAEFSFL